MKTIFQALKELLYGIEIMHENFHDTGNTLQTLDFIKSQNTEYIEGTINDYEIDLVSIQTAFGDDDEDVIVYIQFIQFLEQLKIVKKVEQCHQITDGLVEYEKDEVLERLKDSNDSFYTFGVMGYGNSPLIYGVIALDEQSALEIVYEKEKEDDNEPIITPIKFN